MDSRDNPVFWSISCGNWFMTHVRVSVLVFVVAIGVCLKLHDVKLGALFAAILFVTLLIHEFSHIIAVRWTHGVGNEILIWPLGGLAFVQPAATFRSQFLTPAAGPLSNLLMCMFVLVPTMHSGLLAKAVNPFYFPLAELSDRLPTEIAVLFFWFNWMLFLVNLLPVFPLDGIRMALAVLKSRTDIESAADIAIRISFFGASLIMLLGVILDHATCVLFGAVLLVLSILEWIQMRTAEALDDSFMGYDFSQGYTSLERSSKHDQPAVRRRPGWIQSFRERRRAAKERRLRLEEEEAQKQLDAILEKVHQHGIDSLSDAEHRQLNRVSARLRDRGKHAQ
jgi:stage IV sporulation protein FB